MRTAIAAVCAISALLALGGCGSSSSPTTTTSTGTGTGTTTSASTTATTTSTGTSSSSQSSGIQADGTPRYLKPSKSEPVRSGLVNVAYRDITIQPAVLRVKVGTTVKWTNYDPVDHNVTSESGPQKFESEDFGEGGTYEVKLTKPGIIHYQCTIHPATMNGTIEVVP